MNDNALIACGPVEEIKADVNGRISMIGDGLGIMMAPNFRVLPETPNNSIVKHGRMQRVNIGGIH